MRIKASVGRAKQPVSINTELYSLHLTAETLGERKYMAGLYKAIRVSCHQIKLTDHVPDVKISIRY